MLRVVPAVAMAALLATGISFRGNAVGRFETKLSKDEQILQAVSRLTFGARPGDVEEVRRIGVEKWIQLQLHPDQIPENPVLEARLKPLASLTMDAARIIKEYQPAQPLLRITPINQLLQQEQMRAVMNGTAEQRQAALKALDPEKLKQVLMIVPPQNLEGLPEFQEQAKMARQAQQQEQQKEARRLRPPLNDLLTPDQIQTALHGTVEERQALFNSLDDPAKRRQVAGAMNPRDLADMPEMRREGMVSRQPQQVVLSDLREGKLYRAIYSNRQLEEVLADFWFNHFNVFEAKNVQVANNSYRSVLAGYERDAIRPHVLGRFKDLLLAVARHPAMLYYLDNWESVSPEAIDALKVGPFAANLPNQLQIFGRQAHGLNENFGRELMELHTLGVDGGYTQTDVIAVARCFTGWTIHDPSAKPEFQFASFMHDPAEKTVLGHRIPAGGGEQDGVQVIDILAHHPSTAKFISKKLAQRFVADDPPQALVDRMALTFTKTDGDIRAVLETMFTSREFFSEGAWQAKVKSPLEMVVSAVRALPGEILDTFTLAQKVSDLGEPLYSKEAPTGYPDSGETWLSTSGVLARINLAITLAAGQVPGVKLDNSRFEGKDAAAMTREVLNRDASPQTLAAIADGLQGKEATPALVVGLALSSPEFQRR
jgi:uncharacterized protein (DUF1800 family)